MNIRNALENRSESSCELCKAKQELSIHTVYPFTTETMDHSILICRICLDQIHDPNSADGHHWRCLNDSMWSEHAPIQVESYRMLHRLQHEGWSGDLVEMMYMDDDTLKWAKQGLEANKIVHKDSNGAILESGDTVVLIQDLNVKGANFTAKRGTTVRKISLVNDNADHIEAKVEGQHIVILTKFVKKRHS